MLSRANGASGWLEIWGEGRQSGALFAARPSRSAETRLAVDRYCHAVSQGQGQVLRDLLGFCAIYRLAAMGVRHVCRSFKKEWAAPGRPFGTSSTETARVSSATPRGAAARVALEARAVAHQGEVAAFAAGFALVALGLGLGAFLGCERARVGLGGGARLGAGARLRPRQMLQPLGRRPFWLRLLAQRRGRLGAGPAEGRDVGA